MKFIGKTTIALVAAFVISGGAAAAEWEVDLAHSSVGFAVKHMMVSTVRGSFNKYEAKVIFDDAKPEALQVEAKIDVNSIDTRNAQRDAHLKSADFFEAEKHPQMIFKSKSAKSLGGGKYEVTGDLTMRGVTRQIVLKGEGFTPILDTPWGKKVTAARATALINREDFGLTYNKALETGGFVVGKEVTIELELELTKKNG
ncbi:MAG: YceI family protein [bacterium]|nr:YceI family protein [bacterium]